jgi:hypothetical protein
MARAFTRQLIRKLADYFNLGARVLAVGAADVRARAATREAALATLDSVIAKRLNQGELVTLEVRCRGLTG